MEKRNGKGKRQASGLERGKTVAWRSETRQLVGEERQDSGLEKRDKTVGWRRETWEWNPVLEGV